MADGEQQGVEATIGKMVDEIVALRLQVAEQQATIEDQDSAITKFTADEKKRTEASNKEKKEKDKDEKSGREKLNEKLATLSEYTKRVGGFMGGIAGAVSARTQMYGTAITKRASVLKTSVGSLLGKAKTAMFAGGLFAGMPELAIIPVVLTVIQRVIGAVFSITRKVLGIILLPVRLALKLISLTLKGISLGLKKLTKFVTKVFFNAVTGLITGFYLLSREVFGILIPGVGKIIHSLLLIGIATFLILSAFPPIYTAISNVIQSVWSLWSDTILPWIRDTLWGDWIVTRLWKGVLEKPVTMLWKSMYANLIGPAILSVLKLTEKIIPFMTDYYNDTLSPLIAKTFNKVVDIYNAIVEKVWPTIIEIYDIVSLSRFKRNVEKIIDVIPGGNFLTFKPFREALSRHKRGMSPFGPTISKPVYTMPKPVAHIKADDLLISSAQKLKMIGGVSAAQAEVERTIKEAAAESRKLNEEIKRDRRDKAAEKERLRKEKQKADKAATQVGQVVTPLQNMISASKDSLLFQIEGISTGNLQIA